MRKFGVNEGRMLDRSPTDVGLWAGVCGDLSSLGGVRRRLLNFAGADDGSGMGVDSARP